MGFLTNLIRRTTCQGEVFKADVQHCKTKRGFLFSVRLNKQKRLSCPGCDNCCSLDDEFDEVSSDWPIQDIETAEHDRLYVIKRVDVSKDWESGIIDGWDLKLVPFEQEPEE